MRHALILAAVLASAARAGNVVYEHPALKTRLTVHTVDGAAAPDAVSYEGPKGFFLVTSAELRGIERYDGWANVVYDVRALTADGFLHRENPYGDAEVCSFAQDACVAAVENTIGELLGRGKQEAPDEFAARVAGLRRRAAAARSTWRSYETEAASFSNAILDKAALDAAEAPLAEAAAAIDAARAERVTGEFRAASAAPTAGEPSPKADFYWRQGRALDDAAAKLSRADATLASARTPAY